MAEVNPTEETKTNNNDVRYSPHACAHCRSAHRKCDKILDSCGYCKRTNRKCEYVAPPERKKKRKASERATNDAQPPAKKQKPNPIPELSPQAIFENIKDILPNTNASVSECINAYYSLFCIGLPLLDRDLSYDFLQKMHGTSSSNNNSSGKSNVNSGTGSQTDPNKLNQQVDMPSLLLFISVQIFSLQRLGKRKLASKLFIYLQPLLSRELFTSMSDTSNIIKLGIEQFTRVKLLACALSTLAYYAAGSVGVDATELLVQNGKFFLNKLRKMMLLNKEKPYQVSTFYCRKLEKYLVLADLCVYQHGEDVPAFFKALMEVVRLNFPSDDMNPIANMRPEITPDFLNKLSAVEDAANQSIQSKNGFLPPLVCDIMKLVFHLGVVGVKLTYMMQKQGYEKVMVTIANSTSDIVTSQAQVFGYCPSFTIRGIVNTARIHLQYCTNDKLRLEQDLKAMKVLVDRFDIVSERYLSVIADLERAILQRTPPVDEVSDFIENDLDYTALYHSMFENPFFIQQPEMINIPLSPLQQQQLQQRQQPILPTPQLGSPDNLSFLHNLLENPVFSKLTDTSSDSNSYFDYVMHEPSSLTMAAARAAVTSFPPSSRASSTPSPFDLTYFNMDQL